jgi:serine-type D-Ala-D-Ala carboxypeptidase (penicillin-binding protein 5/6)
VRRRAVRGAVAVLPLLVLVAQTAVGGAVLRTAPPPTPVPPNGSPSPFVSHLSVPADPDPVPKVDAAGVLLVDLGYDQVLFRRAEHQARPIASLTKLMTALLVLEAERGHLDRIVEVPADAVFGRRDYGAGSSLRLREGERISVRSLLAGLLLGSANDAAEALAIQEAGSVSGFVDEMNARARELGMRDTRFASPHGLDDAGRSSPADLLSLLRRLEALGTFRDLVASRFATIPSASGPERRIQNRNVLLWLYPGATGVKTGFTSGAGFCLIATAHRGGRTLAAIVLGGGDEVFSDAAALLNHGFAAYEVRTVVEEREPLGTLVLRGGAVPVVAASDLVSLVPAGEEPSIERHLRPSPKAAYPPPSGANVGTLRVTVGGAVIGHVRVRVGELAPPRPPAMPWWARAAAAIAGGVAAAVGGLFT